MDSSDRLLAAVQLLLAEPAWAAEGEVPAAARDTQNRESTVRAMETLFEKFYEAPCPESFRNALILPDRVDLRWRRESVAGEIKIGNPLAVRKRKLDESVLDWTLGGTTLRDTRILDDVVDYAGPLSVLFRIGAQVVEPTLYLFDSRELRKLELTYDAYLDWAAVSRGIVFWQYLFCDDTNTPDVAKALEAGLALLALAAPDERLEDLGERLRRRTR